MLDFFKKLFLSIVCLELFLGGGGRLVDTGLLSIRMYLFITALVFSFLLIIQRSKIDKNLLVILVLALLQLFLSSMIGLLNGVSTSLVLNDVKPLLFIFSGVFFYSFISEASDIDLIVKLLKFSSLLMAILYLIMFASINLGLIPFLPFYQMVESTEEFFFRGEFAFFYKGFMYLCVGAIFYFWTFKKSSKLVLVLLSSAILLTFTRGFIASSVSVFVIYLVFIQPKYFRSILGLGLIILTLIFGWSFVSNSDRIDRGTSDGDRIIQIKQVAERFTLSTTIVGYGFGEGVPFRPEHMEISYLEIFHKQGLFGLSFWLIIFIYGSVLYRKAKKNGNDELAMPFYLSFMFVYIQSFTNPFINNPIGLSMIMISLAVLRLLSQKPSFTIVGLK